MKDEEKAARFEADLAALKAGREPSPGADLEALALARRLGELDFSAESAVRRSLRARLLSRPRGSFVLPRLAWAAGLAAVLLLVPLGRLWRGPEAPPPPATLQERPAQPSRPAPRTSAQRAPMTRPALPRLSGAFPVPEPARAEKLFVPVPGRSPFRRGPTPLRLLTAKGRPVSTPAGRAVVWDLGQHRFVLEHRALKTEDLFVKPTL